jgi:hypothetical protein
VDSRSVTLDRVYGQYSERLYADMATDPSISADEAIKLAEMFRLMGDPRNASR